MDDNPIPSVSSPDSSLKLFFSDVTSGVVVFLVALPLCLGIALASGAPLISGLIAGIVGGIVVGCISGSHTSVSGPAAGLTAIVLTQIAELGSFEAFLLAVFVGGILQVGMGIARAGSLSAFFPSSVIKGLLAAIGVILILKQVPHLVGHDNDPEGDLSYVQPDNETTFSEIEATLSEWHMGALIVGLTSIALLILWDRWKPLKNSLVPGPLVVVVFGVLLNYLFVQYGGPVIGNTHLVQIPVAESTDQFLKFLTFPDFSRVLDPAIYVSGGTIALVASLETLLNLQAVDKLDKLQRVSPPSRELIAQGAGNMVSGLIGGLPITSVVIRGSVNVNSGSKTKMSAIIHGILLLVCVGLMPAYMNRIPLASLAAILLVTGFKLASPGLFMQMLREGRYQFIPFAVTLVAIVRTNLLQGIGIGLGVSVLFILLSNLRRPGRRVVETHLDGDIVVMELSNQVTFLNRAALSKVLNETKSGSHLLIDATETDYIDPDLLSLFRDFRDKTAPARGVKFSLRGFRKKFGLENDLRFAGYSSPEVREKLTPERVLEILKEGNRRFRSGEKLHRDFSQQVSATAQEQSPFAVILSCIDSRVPAELVFDLGIGDIFSTRVAGNVAGETELGSIEYAVAVSGVKAVVVMGHTRCGAVTSTIQMLCDSTNAKAYAGCDHLQAIIDQIDPCLDRERCRSLKSLESKEAGTMIDEVARLNVLRTVEKVMQESSAIAAAVSSGKTLVVGALYDVSTGEVTFLADPT